MMKATATLNRLNKRSAAVTVCFVMMIVHCLSTSLLLHWHQLRFFKPFPDLNGAEERPLFFDEAAKEISQQEEEVQQHGILEESRSANDGDEKWCDINPLVLSSLREQGLLKHYKTESDDLADEALLRNYGPSWTKKHTCFLLNQLLCTEAIGGHHPHCNTHAQNRNMQYAILTQAGSLKPAMEAIKEMGRMIEGNDYSSFMDESQQVSGMLASEVSSEKNHVLKQLREPGVARLKAVGQDWVNKVILGLQNQTFAQLRDSKRERILYGFSPEEAIQRGWEGSFWLQDLQSPFDIPEVRELAYDPFILDVVQDLLGVPPVIRCAIVSFNVANTKIGEEPQFDFSSWHKDFNTIRTVKVFVYLGDVTDDAHGPHTYIPYTQDVMGPKSQDIYANAYAQSFSAQALPEEYMRNNLFTEQVQKLYGEAGTAWLGDTRIFHKADKTFTGWRGLLQIDYAASGFCGKDHSNFYNVLSRVPPDHHSKDTNLNFPRLFQRALIGNYAKPNLPEAPAALAACARPLEEIFGELQYNTTLAKTLTSHEEYIKSGFATSPMDPKSPYEVASVPCWEHECDECLRDSMRGTCEICSKEADCTCSCRALSCTRYDAKPVEEIHDILVIDATTDTEGNLIPSIVHQIWLSPTPLSEDKFPHTVQMMNRWKNQVGWEYNLIDSDSAARQFLVENFPPMVLEAYDEFVPGSFKSDLLRYCILFVFGGVYADNDLYLMNDLNSFLDRNSTGFFASIDIASGTPSGNWNCCILSGFIATYPGHPAIALAIARTVSNALNRADLVDFVQELCPTPLIPDIITKPELFASGPCVLGTSLNVALGRHPHKKFVGGDVEYSAPLLPVQGGVHLITSRIRKLGTHEKPLFTRKNHFQTYFERIGDHGEVITKSWVTEEIPDSNAPKYNKGTKNFGPWHATHYKWYLSQDIPLNTTKKYHLDVTVKMSRKDGAHVQQQPWINTFSTADVMATALSMPIKSSAGKKKMKGKPRKAFRGKNGRGE